MREDGQICDWQFSITSHIIKKLLKAVLGIVNVLQQRVIKQQRVLVDANENTSWPPLPGFGRAGYRGPFNIFHSVYSPIGSIAVLFARRVL